jgi:hypothetical protein
MIFIAHPNKNKSSYFETENNEITTCRTFKNRILVVSRMSINKENKEIAQNNFLRSNSLNLL